jgi:hypothetical protein
MKKIINLILPFAVLLTVIFSCKSEFNEISQAENKVDENGFRKGRWVDYYDSNLKQLPDSTNFNYYLLSEYENQNLIPNVRMFYKSGLLYFEGVFSDTIKSEKNFDFVMEMNDSSITFKNLKYFSESTKKLTANYNFNDKGILIKKELFGLGFQIIDSVLTDTLIIDYSLNNQNQISSIKINSNIFENTFYFNDKSWAEVGSDEERKEFYEYVLKEMFKKSDLERPYDIFTKEEIYSKQDFFYRLDYSEIKSKTDDYQEKFNWKNNNQPGYETFINSKRARSKNIVRCQYCGIQYNKTERGYQYNPIINFGRKAVANWESVNDVMQNLLKNMGAQTGTTLHWCSERCVYSSGYSITG